MLAGEGFDKLRLFGVKATGGRLRETIEDPSFDSWTLEEKMRGLVDAEDAARQSREVARLVRDARLRLPGACAEDVVHLPGRGLNEDRVGRWASRAWVDNKETMVVMSKSGRGKSFLVQALGVAACRKPHKVRHVRLAGLFDDLARRRPAADGSPYGHTDYYKRVDLPVLDDFLATPTDVRDAIDLFEIIESREGRAATLVASQLEPNERHPRIEGELMADSILDRIATRAQFVDLGGPNMRECLMRQDER